MTAPATRGLLSQYLMSIDIADTVPPTITSDSLPTEGATITGVFDRFNVGFSEDMAAASVNEPANVEIRAAGADDTFETVDDPLYHVANPGYTSGLGASYRIVDGPLQPGRYRVTLKTGLTDRVGNGLAAPYIRTFATVGVTPYILESRSNDTLGTPTSLSLTPGSSPTGTFASHFGIGVGINPWDVATADFNGDGKLDLALTNISSSTVSVLLGNGDGTFKARVDYGTGGSPIGVAIGDLDGDGRLDLAVADDASNGTVSVRKGNGDGTFGR